MNAKKQKGAETVEFAIVAPLLFFVIFAIIEFSMMLYNLAIITAGSREVAREASMYRIEPRPGQPNFGRPIRPTNENANDAVADFFNRFPIISLAGGAAPVPNANAVAARGGRDAVEVAPEFTHNFVVLQPLAALSGGALSGGVNLNARSVMMYEYEHVGLDASN
jgi:hypothetical protein